VNPAKLSQTLNEAIAQHQRGDLAGAETLYRAILKKAPQHFDALHLLGVLYDQRGDLKTGIDLVRRAVKIQPASADAQFNLGRMLFAAGDAAGAARQFTQALALNPAHARAHNELGNAHRRNGAYDNAAASFEKATRYEPGLLEPYINLCNTYRDSCSEAKIFDVADRGLRVDPHNAKLWLLRAEAGFTTGRLADGWRDYAWRFKSSERPVDIHRYDLPMWQGEDLAGKNLLIWCEQGIGDELIFASMIPGIASVAKRCVLHTTPRLAPLFARAFPNVEVFGGTVPAHITGTLDLQTPMGSIGQWRRPTFGSFPAATDYLKADPDKTAALSAKYTAQGKSLLVGLAWRSANVNDAAEKSVSLNQWGAILSVPGVTFVNLQYGNTRAEIAAARDAFKANIIDDNSVDSLVDLDAFAAQVAAMDLVISSSNTAAHIAGALGVPTWCMVPRALGNGRRWYWFGSGPYAPWYRAMTLFRQTEADWMNVLADAALSLVTLAAQSGHLTNPTRYLEGLAQGYASAGLSHEAAKVLSHAAAMTPTARTVLEAARAHLKAGGFSRALTFVERALQMAATAEAHDMHGRILAKLDRQDEAAIAYERALTLDPAVAEVHNNLGTALRRAGRGADALNSYNKAYQLKPDHPSILLNYAGALAENDRVEDALGAYERLVAVRPDNIDGQYNRALTLLTLGRFDAGWPAFKWRLRRGNVHVRHEDFPQPAWSGEDISKQHVLVWTDQGIGDEILTASLVPDAVAAARRVTLLCSTRLVALMRRSFPKAIVDVRAHPLPPAATAKDVNLQMSVAELGAIFRPDLGAFPPRPRFLAADDKLRERLRRKYLSGREGTKLVGIAWRSVNPELGHHKSLPLTHWLPILKTPGVTFVNLQYGDCAAELDALQREHGINIIHDPEIAYFGDIDPVAAQIAAMDHIVSVSNTTVHLAGGLGVPGWVMVPRGLGRLWYWFRGVSHCPWYPSLVLRSPERDDGWNDVVQQIAADLAQSVKMPHG
jgi:tetratricopeptide (TPR) repeat protein